MDMAAVNSNRVVKTTLIISTYNWPEALHLCLLSVSRQSVLPDEVIIADDGSTIETYDLIESLRKTFPVPLIHVWQEDEGFQLAKIRNKAIARATQDYIIQVDGDLILHKHFIEDHLELSKPGTFIAGSRVLMNKRLSEKAIQTCKLVFHPIQDGLKNKFNVLRIKILRKYLSKRYHIYDFMKLRGCNMSFWRQDLLWINGYNEDFYGWGREDNDIALRLMHAGVAKQVLKFGGIAFHLHHILNSSNVSKSNENCLVQTILTKKYRCNNGIDQYLKLITV